MTETVTAGQRVIITAIEPAESLAGFVGTLGSVETAPTTTDDRAYVQTDLDRAEIGGQSPHSGRTWYARVQPVPDLIDGSDLRAWTRTPSENYTPGRQYISTGLVPRQSIETERDPDAPGRLLTCDMDRGFNRGLHVMEGMSNYTQHTATEANPHVSSGDLVLVDTHAGAWALRTVVRAEAEHIVTRAGDVEQTADRWAKAYRPEAEDTPEQLRTLISDYTRRIDLLQDVLGEKAEERAWCSEFEEFCERVDLEARRNQEKDYDVNVELIYTLDEYRLDEIVRDTFGGDHDIREEVSITSNVTIQVTTNIDPDEVDSSVLSDWLSQNNYDGWTDASVTGWDAR